MWVCAQDVRHIVWGEHVPVSSSCSWRRGDYIMSKAIQLKLIPKFMSYPFLLNPILDCDYMSGSERGVKVTLHVVDRRRECAHQWRSNCMKSTNVSWLWSFMHTHTHTHNLRFRFAVQQTRRGSVQAGMAVPMMLHICNRCLFPAVRSFLIILVWWFLDKEKTVLLHSCPLYHCNPSSSSNRVHPPLSQQPLLLCVHQSIN